MVISAVFQASKYTSQCLRWQLGAEKTLQLLSGFQVHIMFEKTQLLSFVKKKTCLSEIFFFACLAPSLRKQNLSFYFWIVCPFLVFSYKDSFLRHALIWCASILVQVYPFPSWQHIDIKQERNAFRWTPPYQSNQRQSRKPGVISWNRFLGCSSVFARIWFYFFFFYSQAVIIIIVFVISRVHYHTNGWWPPNSYKKH